MQISDAWTGCNQYAFMTRQFCITNLCGVVDALPRVSIANSGPTSKTTTMFYALPPRCRDISP
jgi:hypothetical protein